MWLLVNCLTSLVALLSLHHHVAAQSQSPPKITMPPKSMKVAEEGTISFFCKASGNPAPVFHWERNHKKLNDKGRQRYTILDSVPHLSVLRIKPVKHKREHLAVFTCAAHNDLGEARADATLEVYKESSRLPQGYPRILVHPNLKSVEKGHDATVPCEATGTPEPKIMWLKDMLPVDLTDPRVVLMDNGYLKMEDSQEADEATYECVAENSAGVAYSYPAMMYVKVRRVPPRFSAALEDQKVMPESDLNLTCVAVGSPMPFVKWRQGAIDLTGDDDIPIGRNVLQLKGVKESKNYTCEASSELGNIEKVVQVIVEGGE